MRQVVKIEIHQEFDVDEDVVKIIRNMTEEELNDKLEEFRKQFIEFIDDELIEEDATVYTKIIDTYIIK